MEGGGGLDASKTRVLGLHRGTQVSGARPRPSEVRVWTHAQRPAEHCLQPLWAMQELHHAATVGEAAGRREVTRQQAERPCWGVWMICCVCNAEIRRYYYAGPAGRAYCERCYEVCVEGREG